MAKRCKELFVVPTLTNHEFYGIFYWDVNGAAFNKRERIAVLLAFIAFQFCFTTLFIPIMDRRNKEFCDAYVESDLDNVYITKCVISPNNATYTDQAEYCQNHGDNGIYNCCDSTIKDCKNTAITFCSCAGKIVVPLITSIGISIIYTIISFPFKNILKRQSTKYNWIGYILILGLLALSCFLAFDIDTKLMIFGMMQVGLSLFIISPIVGTILMIITKRFCPCKENSDDKDEWEEDGSDSQKC